MSFNEQQKIIEDLLSQIKELSLGKAQDQDKIGKVPPKSLYIPLYEFLLSIHRRNYSIAVGSQNIDLFFEGENYPIGNPAR